MRKINKIIIHCSATKEGRDIKTDTIKSWHMKGRGWSDIGYHFVIELDGTIKQGRNVEKIGAHTKGENTNSIGVCYVGGVDDMNKAKDTRTEAQKESMIELIESLKSEYKTATIHGHNEYANKACPSFDVKKEFGKYNKKEKKKENDE